MTKKTDKINHQFECNERCLVYLLTCKKFLKQYAGQTIDTFWHRWNNYKSKDRKFQRSEWGMQEHLFRHFSSPGRNGFLNDVSVTFLDKTGPSDPLKRQIFGEKHLWLVRPISLILKIVSDFYHLIILKLAFFILPLYCTLWIIGMTCFSGLKLWKMNLFSHYFINFSFTFLFIVTSIITMVTLLLLLLFLLNLPVLFSFVMSCLFLLLF